MSEFRVLFGVVGYRDYDARSEIGFVRIEQNGTGQRNNHTLPTDIDYFIPKSIRYTDIIALRKNYKKTKIKFVEKLILCR